VRGVGAPGGLTLVQHRGGEKSQPRCRAGGLTKAGARISGLSITQRFPPRSCNDAISVRAVQATEDGGEGSWRGEAGRAVLCARGRRASVAAAEAQHGQGRLRGRGRGEKRRSCIQTGNYTNAAPERARRRLLWFSTSSARAALQQEKQKRGCSLRLKASDFRVWGREVLSMPTRAGYFSKGGGGI